jgi:hypothetical protein
MPRPILDERYRAREAVNVLGMVQFAAPYTGSFRAVIAAGEIVRIASEPRASSTGVYVLPDDEMGREAALVPADDREDPLYRGYVLSLSIADLIRYFDLVL